MRIADNLGPYPGLPALRPGGITGKGFDVIIARLSSGQMNSNLVVVAAPVMTVCVM